MELILLDNYDSFTYNIAHIFNELPDVNLQIIRADQAETGQLDLFDAIIFSPGPDIPRPGNAMEKILKRHAHDKAILGICLGLQAIVQYFGGSLERLDKVVHGRTRIINVISDDSVLFRGLQTELVVGLYHSWIASTRNFPASLEITAVSEERRIMAIRHRQFNIEAVQFHPESIMTPHGTDMILQWLNNVKMKLL